MDLLSILHLPFTTALFYALPFLVALMIIVFVHEYGHFIVARWCGVKVKAFSIGFGKEIAGWHDRHGTRWKLSWLPLGGYVKFMGDANAASLPDAAAHDEKPRDPGNFHGKPVWQRAAVVAAGPVANFLLAIAIFAVLFATYGKVIADPVIRDRIAAIEARLLAAEYNGYRLLTMGARGEDPGLAAMVTKLHTTNLIYDITKLAMDVLSDRGLCAPGEPSAPDMGMFSTAYMWYFGMALGGGAPNIQRNIIGERGLGLPRDARK